MIRVLITDDNAVFRRGLRAVLEADGSFQVVGEAGDGHAAVREAERTRPDLVVMDIRMPGQDGLTAARAEAEAMGCSGYLLKSSEPAVLVVGMLEGSDL